MDAQVRAPVAQVSLGKQPSPELERQVLQVENTELRQRIRELEISCTTISRIAIALARMSRDLHGSDPIVPKDLHERMQGASISLRALPKGDILVEHRERSPRPVILEEV